MKRFIDKLIRHNYLNFKYDIKIKQNDISDCGAACLASICSYYRLIVPIAKIRQLAGTNKNGTNLYGLVKASEKLGFESKGVKGNIDSLIKIPKPAIAHLIIDKQLYHYVVIYKVQNQKVLIMDPATGDIHLKKINEFRSEWTGVLMLLKPKINFNSGRLKVSNWTRLMHLVKPHKHILLLTLLGSLTYTILGLTMSIYIQKITDLVLYNENVKLLNSLSLFMLVIIILQVFIGLLKEIFLLRTGQKIDSKLVLGYYKHLLNLSQSFFDSMRVGEIISRINDAVKIRVFISNTSLSFIANIFALFITMILMFSYYWKLAIVVLSIVPIYTIIYLISNHLNKKIERKVIEDMADLESHLIESISSIFTIKCCAAEEYANYKTESKFIHLLKSGFKSALISIYSSHMVQFISKLIILILFWVGSYFVIEKEITPGELFSFYALLGFLTGPVSNLISLNKNFQKAFIAADRLFEIMDLESEQLSNSPLIKIDKNEDIFFDDITFRYSNMPNLFLNFTLRIEKEKVTAIIGKSGSGKSTLIYLLQKLYPIQKGKIRIGITDLNEIKNKSLRKLIGVVPQKIELFNGDIFDNIAFGDSKPDTAHIINICNSLGIIDFIKSLPSGFNTCIGEGGAAISGGERQKIALARALYSNPKILILDEATSSLDNSSELYIKRIIQKLKNKRITIIIISHSLRLVKDADTIIVLKKGALIEQGTHQSLRNKGGLYFKLYKNQV